MRNKKLLSMAIAASIVFGTASTAFASADAKAALADAAAETKTSTDQAKDQQVKIAKDAAKQIGKSKLKEYLGYDLDESKFQVQFNLRPNYYNSKDAYVWDINWSASDALKTTNIRVTLDANSGKVTSAGISVYSKLTPPSTAPSVTQDKAKEAADAFVGKVFPNELKDLKLVDNNSADKYIYGGSQPLNYSFTYQRYYNGILLDGDYVTVDVDGTSGNVISFDSRWTDNLNLPSSEGIITKEKAEDLLKTQTAMNLMYLPYRDKYQYEPTPSSIKLIYTIGDNSPNILDAKTGSILPLNGSNQQTETKDLTADERSNWLKNAKDLSSAASEIDSATAQQVMITKLQEIYGQTYKIENLSYEENNNNYDTNGRKAWRASFYKEVDGKRTDESGNILIDALNQGIISLYRYDSSYKYDEEFTPKLSWAEAYSKALGTLAKYFPDKIKDIKTEQKNIIPIQPANAKQVPQREYSFNFSRVVNSIIYRNDNINMIFDAKTGLIRQVSCNWSNNITFPASTGIMSSDDSKAIYFKKYNPELAYSLNQTTQSDGSITSQYNLVYRLKPAVINYAGQYIDAFNGKLLNYDGQEVLDQSNEFFNKIKGSKYEKELSTLAYQGILDVNTFELNKEVTALDFVKMLVNAKGYRPYLLKEAASVQYSNVKADSPDYKYLQMAIFYGILENKAGDFDFNQKITRTNMAKALINILGYDKLAKASDIFTLSINDSSQIDKADIGYMAIAKALGILDIQNNNIRPKDNATMLELSLAVYKVMDSLKTMY